MDAQYLEKHKKQSQFKLYTVVSDYFPVDGRHLGLSVGETVTGFS
jgi:hypothetical protein